MPDPNQLAQLRRSVAAWNEWRAANPTTEPELQGLNPLDFHSLSRGPDDTFDVWLDGALLHRANLRGAHFEDISLVGVSFGEADLTDATFVRCALGRAVFDGADLRRVRFARSDLRGTRFRRARFGETALIGLNLAAAVALDEAEHFFPSVIDTGTLELTAEGQRLCDGPDATLRLREFFRGCGVSGRLLVAAIGELGLD